MFIRGLFFLTAALLAAQVSAAEAPPLEWTGAKWIWCLPQPTPALGEIPEGVCSFRAGIAVSEQARIVSADLLATADNLYDISINGKPVGGNLTHPNDWNKPKRFNVAELLTAGDNVIAVEAANTAPGPAGLLLKLRVVLSDGRIIEQQSDESWRCTAAEEPNWKQLDFNDQAWSTATPVADFGAGPWGRLGVPPAAEKPSQQNDDTQELTPPPDYPWPEGMLFVGDDCSLTRSAAHGGTAYSSLNVTIFNPGHTRAFPEHDLPGPMKVGRKLMAMIPAKPGTPPRLLLDAGEGAIGSPTVTFDGRFILFSMVPAGDAFFHIYRIPSTGGSPQQLTSGRFHDIDPVETADGRIVFTSTRCGYFEEYHNTPSRSLFAMQPDGSQITPLTSTFIFDNEPEIMADGRILFIRSDNFFDRGKVETLLHAIHPDGSHGYTEFGLDLGPAYGNRLRAFNCGSPAPMPDGRVAYLTGSGIAVGRPGCAQRDLLNLPLAAGDVAALPDGRLLCTSRKSTPYMQRRKEKRPAPDGFNKIGIVDPEHKTGEMVTVFTSAEGGVHSPVFLGARKRPSIMPLLGNPEQPTGVLYCQDVRLTRKTGAGWPHVRAIRVLAGLGLTVRSSHSYIVHAGNETVELGVVPISPDGSFAVEVPADTAIAFQAVDAEGRSELNEMSWIFVRPGETRGCIGCHAVRQSAPPMQKTVPHGTMTTPLRLTLEGDPHRFRGNNAAVTGLTELQFDRFREVAGLNRFSATPQELAERLSHPDSEMRAKAAHRLGLRRSSAAAPALALALGDSAREVRVAAAFALSTCGNRDSLPPLLKTAADPDPLVRSTAAIALENLTGHSVSNCWSSWLSSTTPEAIESALIKRLAGTDRDDVRRAAAALGHTASSEAARAALRSLLQNLSEDTAYVEWRKKHRGDNAKFQAADAVNPRTVQEVARALGRLHDSAAVPLLTSILGKHSDPATGNLFLAEAVIDALGEIGTPESLTALSAAFLQLKDYIHFTSWYGDHGALMACHASPVHHRIIEALYQHGVTQPATLVPHLIHCVPTDTDRALFPANDDCEELIGAMLRRLGAEARVTESCLAALEDPQAIADSEVTAALKKVHGAWGGTPDLKNRAAQILSLTCRDPQYLPRIQGAFTRYAAQKSPIARVFDKGIPVVQELPLRNWVCFFLARSMGALGDKSSLPVLTAALEAPGEYADGSPDPLGPGISFLHNELTPCWRAAAAWAIGRIGDPQSAPLLLRAATDPVNASDTRSAAAKALGTTADPSMCAAILQLAAAYPETSTRLALIEAEQMIRKRSSRSAAK